MAIKADHRYQSIMQAGHEVTNTQGTLYKARQKRVYGQMETVLISNANMVAVNT